MPSSRRSQPQNPMQDKPLIFEDIARAYARENDVLRHRADAADLARRRWMWLSFVPTATLIVAAAVEHPDPLLWLGEYFLLGFFLVGLIAFSVGAVLHLVHRGDAEMGIADTCGRQTEESR